MAAMLHESNGLTSNISFTYSHVLISSSLGFLFLQICYHFPAALTTRSLQLMTCLFAARVAGATLFAPSAAALVSNLPLFLGSRMLSGFFSGPLLSVPLNLVMSATTCYAYSAFGASGDLLPVHLFVRREILMACVLVIVCCVSEGMVEAQVRATLKFTEVSQLHSTVKSLLSVLCDATVDLDADLMIQGSPMKLGALLLHPAPTHTLEGRFFPDLMPPSEAERFKDHIQSASRIHAQSVNVHLRDSSSTLVSVELLHASFQDLEGQTKHILGVRELQGQSGASALECCGPEAVPAATQRCAQPAASETAASEAANSSWGSSASDVVMPLASQLAAAQQPPVFVVFQPMAQDLRVVRCSPAFTFLCGLSPEGCSLLEWVHRRQAFCAWVQDLTNAHFSGRAPTLPAEVRLTLRFPVAVASGYEFRANSALAFQMDSDSSEAESDEEMSDFDDILATLTLSRIRRRRLSA